MKLSVIIPAYNEADIITETVEKVRSRGGNDIAEVIVVDGGSTDKTLSRARKTGAKVLQSPQKGRAAQMNYGAAHAKTDLLYFLHADSYPPPHFTRAIKQALDKDFDAGCFRLQFDDTHWLLRLYAWFTRFDINAFRFGDQSLFVRHTVFSGIGGFREDHIVMEDQEIVRRIKRSFSFRILDGAVTTSARTYREIGIVRLQMIFFLIFSLYYLGVEQEYLVSVYNRLIQ